jgi:hypothetical protein
MSTGRRAFKMTWILVGIVINSTITITATNLGQFDTMYDCFGERDEYLIKQNAFDGIPQINTQFICVPTEYTENE